MDSSRGAERGDLSDLLGVMRRRAGVIVLAVVVAVGAALFYSSRQPKKYQSTAKLLFRPLLLDVQVTGLPLQLPSSDPTREAATNVGLASLENVRALAAASLGPGYSASTLKNEVSVSNEGTSELVAVTATAHTPQRAADVANAMAQAFIAFERASLVGRVNAVMSKVHGLLKHASGPVQRALLQTDETKLTLLAATQPADVQQVGTAPVPTSPSSPKPLLYGAIGGLLGLVLGVALAFGIEQSDRRVRRPDELEGTTGLPLLASVPRSRALRKGRVLTTGLSNGEVEAFRFLRENLRESSGVREMPCVLVTSVGPGSGKTTVALHLAATAAVGEDAVLLIEADLRRPRLGKMLGLPADHGLSTILESPHSLDQALNNVWTVPIGESSNGSEPDPRALPGGFDVLAAGPAHPKSTELLRSRKMHELLRWAQSEYALTIIDGPPPGFVSDAIPLMRYADGVIVVARLGHEHGPELQRLRNELDRLGVETLGVVANFTRPVKNPYAVWGR
jgi:non-specific protein-tyrosine kinase